LPMALLDMALDEPDRALARLQRTCATHTLGTIGITPLYERLRAERRIATLPARCDADDPTMTPRHTRSADAAVHRRR